MKRYSLRDWIFEPIIEAEMVPILSEFLDWERDNAIFRYALTHSLLISGCVTIQTVTIDEKTALEMQIMGDREVWDDKAALEQSKRDVEAVIDPGFSDLLNTPGRLSGFFAMSGLMSSTVIVRRSVRPNLTSRLCN